MAAAVALARSVWLISVIAVAVFGCSAAVATGYWQPAAIGVGFGGAQAGLAIVAGWRIRQVRESLPDPVAPAVLALCLALLVMNLPTVLRPWRGSSEPGPKWRVRAIK